MKSKRQAKGKEPETPKKIEKTTKVEKSSKKETKEIVKKEKKGEYKYPELEEIQEGFDDFDVKHKGVINTDEFCEIMQAMKLNEKYPYLYSVFENVNKDITYDELLDILNKAMEENNKKENLRKLFDFFLEEEAGSDKLPWYNFVKMAKELNENKTEEELRQLLTLSGLNTEQLTFDEFCIAMAETGLDK